MRCRHTASVEDSGLERVADKLALNADEGLAGSHGALGCMNDDKASPSADIDTAPLLHSMLMLRWAPQCHCARALSLSAFQAFTHLYLRSSLKSVDAVFLSNVFVKRFSAGGTFSRWFNTRLCRCSRTYFGHFTKRCRSPFGGGALPTPVCRRADVSMMHAVG